MVAQLDPAATALRFCNRVVVRNSFKLHQYPKSVSGIVGIINLDGTPVDRALLMRMTEFMSFRGPDAQEIRIDGNVGFGHTMLRTTFEAETEKQPLTLDGKLWLSGDVRIDGRPELISE